MIKIRNLFFIVPLIICSFLFSYERDFQTAGKEGRIALVIGNASYKSSPLSNPVNDAEDMANVLRGLGFEVMLRTDINHKGMEEAIRDFGKKLQKRGVGLFYFSGHGVQVSGTNYLIPVNENIQAEDEIKFRAVDANFVLSKMESAGNAMNIMILDACRDNPFARSFRSSSRGLAQMDAPQGSLIVYATGPGMTAADGKGRNGIFTKYLLKVIQEKNLEIAPLLREVRKGVVDETNGNQTPWESSSLMSNFYFSLTAPKSPETAEFDLSNIEGWQDWQKNMNNNFSRVENIHNDSSISSEAKKSTWQQFLHAYRENNPYSSEDEQLRHRGQQRIKELSKVEKPIGALVSLRSYAQNLSVSEVEVMLKQKNFFSKQYNWNKNLSNPRGDFANEYEVKMIHGDKVVLDHATGLMWHQSGSDIYSDYEEAKQWIFDLNNRGYAGYYNWRLPTLEEGLSLLERTEMNGDLYIDPKFLTKQRYIWTSDSTISGQWVVYFSEGILGTWSLGHCGQYGGYHVRPVRSGK